MSAIFAAISPFQIAVRLMAAGVKEIPGTKTNWLVAAMNWMSFGKANEDDPWCGSAVHFCHYVTGYESPKDPGGARNWLSVGLRVDTDKASPGDVVILWREQRDGWKGHVAFFHSWGPNNTVNLLGGNQSDGFTIAPFPRTRILGVRTPVLTFNPHTYLATLKIPTATVSEV
jgi:uncharacterized protein (TIGR02594 family)